MRQLRPAGAHQDRGSITTVIGGSASAFTVAGGMATLADLTTPFGNMSGYLFVAGALVLIIAGTLLLTGRIGLMRALPVLVFAGGAVVISLWFMVLQPNGKSTGFIAAHVPQLESMQHDISRLVGITQDIATDVGRTADNTDRIATDTGQIAANTAATKRETSDDPRKELANLGHTYSLDSFYTAMGAVDIRALDLFLAAGMRFNNSVLESVAKFRDAEMRQYFLANRAALAPDACDLESISHGDFPPAGGSFLKAMCGAEAIFGYLDNLIEQQHRRVAAFANFPTAQPGLLQSCIDTTTTPAGADPKTLEGLDAIVTAAVDTGINLLVQYAASTGLVISTAPATRSGKIYLAIEEYKKTATHPTVKEEITMGCTHSLKGVEAPNPPTSLEQMRRKWEEFPA